MKFSSGLLLGIASWFLVRLFNDFLTKINMFELLKLELEHNYDHIKTTIDHINNNNIPYLKGEQTERFTEFTSDDKYRSNVIDRIFESGIIYNILKLEDIYNLDTIKVSYNYRLNKLIEICDTYKKLTSNRTVKFEGKELAELTVLHVDKLNKLYKRLELTLTNVKLKHWYYRWPYNIFEFFNILFKKKGGNMGNMPKIYTIFEQDINGQKVGNLGVDVEGNLYWNEKKILLEQKITLHWFVNVAIIVTAISTFVIALVEVLNCFHCC